MVKPVKQEHWWKDLSPEDQKAYLHKHPHSHKHVDPSNTIPIDTKYTNQIAKVYNQFNADEDNTKLHHYLDRHLTDEEKQDLEDAVTGRGEYSPKVKTAFKKILMIAFSGAIIGAGIAISTPLLLSCYAAFKVAGKDPAKWLYDKIHNCGKEPYTAVSEALNNSYEFKPIDDNDLEYALEEEEL